MTRAEKIEKARQEFEQTERAAWEIVAKTCKEQNARVEQARNTYRNAQAYSQDD